jgi:hypothetical protein
MAGRHAGRTLDGPFHAEDSMLRSLSLVLLLPLVFGAAEVSAQATKKAAPPPKSPSAKDNSITVNVFLRDAGKNEVLLATRIWPGYPEYNAYALQQFFAMMKSLEPAYKQDDDVAYTWSTKGKVTKCAIYLESAEVPLKTGTGAIVGCEANGVSNLAVTSVADPKKSASTSQDPKHLSDVMDLFRKQSERAKGTLPKQ